MCRHKTKTPEGCRCVYSCRYADVDTDRISIPHTSFTFIVGVCARFGTYPQLVHYILAGLFPANIRKGDAILALVGVCNSILTTSSDYTSNNRDKIDQLKVKVTEALVLCENVLPRSELPVMNAHPTACA